MEDPKAVSSATNLVSVPAFLRPRHVPDVPEDVDFVMEHLNDPNFDLTQAHPSVNQQHPQQHHIDSYELEHKKFSPSDVDSESQYASERYASSRAESRQSMSIDFDDESPYPEVRAAVSSVDDPLMPVNTFRMWLLGCLYAIVISGLNQLFAMRYPSIFITGIVAQLTALPLGKGLEFILPTRSIRIAGKSLSLNPGPFNIKEHVCITVMANISLYGAYATDIIATQKIFYQQETSYAYTILLALSTQIIGFALAGFLRRFLVWPASMIWPGALVNAALFNTLHKNYRKRDRGHMSREKFFVIAFVCSFVWYWIPGFLFTGLSVFNWACWIAPENVVVNALFGTGTGLGMSILTFDWSMISFVSSPLVSPWWSQMNTGAALILFFWIVTPAVYFSNTWFTKFMPISTIASFDNTGMPYDPTLVMSNGTFDAAKFEAYSPVYMPASLAIAYGIAFASFTAVIVHTFLWFRRDIVRRFRSSLKDERDVHSRLMQVYPEVPGVWYALVGLISLLFLLVSIEIFPTRLPIWGALLALGLAAMLAIPVGMIQAITNQQVGLQVMHELIAGYIWPGRPVANMIFKALAHVGTNQAVSFAADLKLGHYMKVPPRMMFSVQVVAAIIGCFVSTGVQEWMFANIQDICTPGQVNGFTCPSTNTLGTSSIIWGGIGPAKLFSPGQMYSGLLWFFLAGALAPIPFYFLAKRFPLSFWRYISMPVFFAGVGAMPPASGINYASWVITGFIFNYCIRRFHFRWWMRYNYILSAALDAGVAIAIVVIFFTLTLPKNVSIDWWGNNVWMKTFDAMGMPAIMLEPGQTFGPISAGAAPAPAA
jgi:OPT family small oligopeptide transporter